MQMHAGGFCQVLDAVKKSKFVPKTYSLICSAMHLTMASIIPTSTRGEGTSHTTHDDSMALGPCCDSTAVCCHLHSPISRVAISHYPVFGGHTTSSGCVVSNLHRLQRISYLFSLQQAPYGCDVHSSVAW
jgi:hypothetical protein